MKKSRNERLSEHLLNVDEDILANAYEVDDAEKLRMYIKTKNARNKKPLYVTHISRRATAIAACFLLIIGVSFSVPVLFSPDADKIPYVVADSNDIYGLEFEDLKSRNKKYISPALQEKMQAYSGTNAVYKVVLEIIITVEDDNIFPMSNDELIFLYKQKNEAFEAYRKANASLDGVRDEKIRAQIIDEIDKKEKTAKYLDYKYMKFRKKLFNEHYENIANARFEYASKLSETAPICVSDVCYLPIFEAYNKHAYFMDLTAEDINDLAQKGGYLFRLASSPSVSIPYLEQE